MTDDYFVDTAVRRRADAVGSYASVPDLPSVEAAPGVSMQVLKGENLMLSYVTVAPGGVAAVHVHDEEQIGLILSGTAEMTLDGVSRQLGPGDIYSAPPGVPHGLVAGADGCVVVDIFTPPRQALLALLGDAVMA